MHTILCLLFYINKFKSNKVLKLFNPLLPTAMETDASSVGLDATLMQKHDSCWYPVMFASRTLNVAEKKFLK